MAKGIRRRRVPDEVKRALLIEKGWQRKDCEACEMWFVRGLFGIRSLDGAFEEQQRRDLKGQQDVPG
jgi:hypothetical protein